ncbi:MAG: SIMPL domain-containing protein [Alphaproteobacteria bacterium]|nr:SIMPL domain-containing protein [Alphaproteobacteria bacterium]
MKHLFTLVLLFLSAAPAFAQLPPPMPPSIAMTGEAKEEVTPDQAVITATLTSREARLDVAKRNNDAQLEKVIQIAQEFKIPKEKIKPSYMNISPEYTYNNAQQKQELVGYMVSRTLQITLDKLDSHERVLAALVEAKIDQVSGVDFRVSNPDAISDRLRIKAMENAKAKAAALAAAAGAKLGRPYSIQASGSYLQPPMPMPMMAMARADVAMEKSSVAPSLPGLVEIRETVNVVFTLE